MERKIIKVGDRHKHLTVIKCSEDNSVITCKCDCGNIVSMSHYKFLNNATCGVNPLSHRKVKHGLSKSRIYRIWHGMNERCKRPSCNTFKNYGANGITICNEWDSKNKDGFLNFYMWSQGKYKDDLTIDRIDPDNGYSPENCRWATYKEQNSHHKISSSHKTGYRNVYPTKYGTYQVIMSIDDKSYNVGSFKKIKDAVEARNKFIDLHNLPNPKDIYVGERK